MKRIPRFSNFSSSAICGLPRASASESEAAGASAAGGRFGPKAAELLAAGQAGIMRVTAAADAPIPVKTPAIPEPNGQ